jgi:hypothetical protein
MHFKIYAFLISVSLLLSCNNYYYKENESKPPTTKNKFINFKKSLVEFNIPVDLVIDDLTSVYFELQDSSLYIFDLNNKRILKYSFINKTYKKIETADTAFLEKAISVSFFSADTFLVYSSTAKNIYLFDIKNNAFYKTYEVNIPNNTKDSKTWYPKPLISNTANVYVKANKLFMTGYVSGESDKEVFTMRTLGIDFKSSDSLLFRTPYPPVYSKSNFGGFYYRIPYSTVNYKTQSFFISLPASHDVIKVNMNNDSSELINMSPPKGIKIPSLDFSKENLKKNSLEIASHFSRNFSYKNIIYHPSKNIYLRVLENPIEGVLNEYNLGYKKCTVLLFDSDFSLTGQFELDKFLSTDNYFLTKSGICFLKGDNKNEAICQYLYYEF